VSITQWVGGSPGPGRRRRRESLRHVRLEIDLERATRSASRIPGVGVIETALREREVVEPGDLPGLIDGILRGCSAVGYRDVLHWETRPGGWLPLHHLPPAPEATGIGALREAVEIRGGPTLASARAFAARLRGPTDRSLEFVVRRVHRERRHSLTIDLHGTLEREEVHALVAALARHLPPLHAEVAAMGYGPRPR
jgi:hypothetical protein